jgi:hypothetical protein
MQGGCGSKRQVAGDSRLSGTAERQQAGCNANSPGLLLLQCSACPQPSQLPSAVSTAVQQPQLPCYRQLLLSYLSRLTRVMWWQYPGGRKCSALCG